MEGRSTDGSLPCCLLPGRHHLTDHASANSAISPSTRPLDSSLDRTRLSSTGGDCTRYDDDLGRERVGTG